MADENRVKSYKTVYRGGMGEIVEKKSRFIAHVAHVESEEEALAFVEKIKKNIGMQGITVMLLRLEFPMKLPDAVMTGNRHRQLANRCWTF